MGSAIGARHRFGRGPRCRAPVNSDRGACHRFRRNPSESGTGYCTPWPNPWYNIVTGCCTTVRALAGGREFIRHPTHRSGGWPVSWEGDRKVWIPVPRAASGHNTSKFSYGLGFDAPLGGATERGVRRLGSRVALRCARIALCRAGHGVRRNLAHKRRVGAGAHVLKCPAGCRLASQRRIIKNAAMRRQGEA